MKIVPFFKSLSRSVHEEQNDHDDQESKAGIDSSGPSGACTSISLTVWRKSLVISCKGFTVIDSNGDLVYRVDNYVGHPQEVTLMDGSGKSVLTMRRNKKFSLVESWFVFEGDVGGFFTARTTRAAPKSWPVFCVRKNKNMLNANPSTLAHVYREASGSHKRCAYVIEGSYTHRSCKVLEEFSRNVVAEIKRKEANVGGVSYGLEVFHLVVHPGFDPGFAMALVLLLDQMF
ncbi:protein LURP-one-related 17 [Rosa sericea]